MVTLLEPVRTSENAAMHVSSRTEFSRAAKLMLEQLSWSEVNKKIKGNHGDIDYRRYRICWKLPLR